MKKNTCRGYSSNLSNYYGILRVTPLLPGLIDLGEDTQILKHSHVVKEYEKFKHKKGIKKSRSHPIAMNYAWVFWRIKGKQ